MSLFTIVVLLSCFVQATSSWVIGAKISKINELLHKNPKSDDEQIWRGQRRIWVIVFTIIQVLVVAALVNSARIILSMPV